MHDSGNTTPPLVTIGITNYNYEYFVTEVLNSVLDQTYRPIEILFYDDCSSDNSVDIVSEMYGDTVSLLIPEKNSGQGFGVNWILRVAKGDYFLIIDGDDVLAHNQVIERLVKAINGNDVLYGLCTTLSDGNFSNIDRHSYINDEVKKLSMTSSIASMAQLMPRANKLISLKYARECGLKNSLFRVMDDALFAMTLALGKPKVGFIDETITAIRVHTGSTSNIKTEAKVKEILGVTEELYCLLKTQDIMLRLKLAGNNLVYFLLYSPANFPLVLKNINALSFNLRMILAFKLLIHKRPSLAFKILLNG